MDEEPLYVNAKQYHRILKRRAVRAKLEAQNKIPKARKVGVCVCVRACVCECIFRECVSALQRASQCQNHSQIRRR